MTPSDETISSSSHTSLQYLKLQTHHKVDMDSLSLQRIYRHTKLELLQLNCHIRKVLSMCTKRWKKNSLCTSKPRHKKKKSQCFCMKPGTVNDQKKLENILNQKRNTARKCKSSKKELFCCRKSKTRKNISGRNNQPIIICKRKTLP